eukprot:scaffold15922_cov104-Skeletonema_dohrnii-CCMP3373.AAC.8
MGDPAANKETLLMAFGESNIKIDLLWLWLWLWICISLWTLGCIHSGLVCMESSSKVKALFARARISFLIISKAVRSNHCIPGW